MSGKGNTIIETIAGRKGIHKTQYIETIAGGKGNTIQYIKSYRCASSVEPSPTYRVALNFDFAASKSNCSSV